MELIAIILSGFLSVFANGGWVIDTFAHKQLNSYVKSAEKLAVRVDNAPNYQIAQGNIDRLRIAARGIYLESNLRIESLELETDPIALDLSGLSTESLAQLRSSLQKPLQGAVSLVLTEQDLVTALQSEAVVAQLQSALNKLIASRAGSSAIAYTVLAPEIQLLPDNLISVEVTLVRKGQNIQPQSKELKINLAMGLNVIEGKQIQLTKLEGTVNDRPISQRLLQGFAAGISDRLNLATIEKQGIFARLLQLEIVENKIKIVGFARMETKLLPVNSGN